VVLLLVLALILFAVGAIGLAIGRSWWLAFVAAGLALVTAAAHAPHLGVH
jgi:hypothetical protein